MDDSPRWQIDKANSSAEVEIIKRLTDFWQNRSSAGAEITCNVLFIIEHYELPPCVYLLLSGTKKR